VSKERFVSATLIRRRGLRAVGAAAIALVALAGCTTGQSSASSYDEARKNFLEGCIETAEADNEAIEAGAEGAEGATRISSPKAYCECVFAALEDEVEFDRYREVNDELKEEGGPLPEDLLAVYASCDPGEGA
jgi:hypothetical protein